MDWRQLYTLERLDSETSAPLWLSWRQLAVVVDRGFAGVSLTLADWPWFRTSTGVLRCIICHSAGDQGDPEQADPGAGDGRVRLWIMTDVLREETAA
jgi:hypothetical protein